MACNAAIQFAAKIHKVLAMHFLNEDHRDAARPHFVNRKPGFGNPSHITGHMGDGSVLLLDKAARLNVDHH